MTDKDTGRPEGALGASGTGEPEAPGDDPLGDTADLLRPGLTFEPQPAWEQVRDEIVTKLLEQ